MSLSATALPTGPVWDFFRQLSAIPRESKHEDRAVEWLVRTGTQLGCEVETQPLAGPDRPHFANVLLRKAACPGCEAWPVIALQAHIDMVCEQNEGTGHDFTRDGIRLFVDGDHLRAEGTTLGADNGIGVCAALAALAGPGLRHGPLEVLITVDEEAGMSGARLLRPGWLRARHLFNLDSEEEGEATISCAGARDSTGRRPLARVPAPAGTSAFALKVRGLRGGHSGLNIGENRGNAIKVLSGVLSALHAVQPVTLAGVTGGNKRNAIPREATAHLWLDPAFAISASALVAQAAGAMRAAFPEDPGLTIALEPATAPDAFTPADGDSLIRVLESLPHGVAAMSAEVPGLVETSTNLALVAMTASGVEINLLTRSSVDVAKAALSARIAAVFATCGFSCDEANDYPGWQPQPHSAIARHLQRVHRDVTGRELKISAFHAGLECGLLGMACPGIEMISFGPNMWGVHTPQEHVSISSTDRFFSLLCAVLSRGGEMGT
jgi:dipeptidase D